MRAGDDPRLGSVVAGYRLEALLGRDDTGVVYLAEQVRLGQRVTLRLLHAELSADERFRERFLREAKLVASLEHPGILPVVEAGEAGGHLYLVMGHVEGTDLAGLLAGGRPLGAEWTLRIVDELAGALDTARFARGLVHGSVGPGKVLVAASRDGAPGERVLLRGFGLRRELPAGAAATVAAERLGTIDYLAPEQIEGKPVNPRTDVYALGCLLYHCLTGEPPFAGATPAALAARLHAQPPSATRANPDLPAAVNAVIRTALATWPEERYPTCAELAAAAHTALAARKDAAAPLGVDRPFPAVVPPRAQPAVREEQAAPSATDGQPAARAASWARTLGGRRRTALAIAGLAVLFAALAAAVVWRTGSDTGDPGSRASGPPSAEAPGGAAAAGAATSTPPAAPEPPAAAEPPGAAPAALEPQPSGAAEAPSEPDAPAALDQLVSFGSGSLVRIDGDAGEVAARVAIPAPALVAADSGSVWVLTEGGSGRRQLVRVEQATSAVVEVFAAAPPLLVGEDRTRNVGLAAIGGDAFVGLGWDRGLYRFTPGRGAGEPVPIDRFLDGGLGNDRTLWPVAAAGSLWVRGGEGGARLLRLDPATGSVLDHLGSFDRVVAAGRGFVWALGGALDGSSDDDLLARIDTATGETEPLPWLPGWRDFVAAGAVWASSGRHDAILRLDPDTGEEIERIALAGTPSALAAGGGAVWAALSGERAVARYDLASGRLTTIDVAGEPVDLAFAAGSLWVGVNDPSVETRLVNGVRFSFARPDAGWQRDFHPIRQAPVRVSKGTEGGQDAEGVVFWTGFPRGGGATACGALQDREIGPSIADLAAAVAAAPGTELIRGPSDVTVGGRPAKYVELAVREDLGCDPGYFYAWEQTWEWCGECWLETTNGDTIRVWIVDVDGTRLFIEAETQIAELDLEREIHQIVDSIRFETASPG